MEERHEWPELHEFFLIAGAEGPPGAKEVSFLADFFVFGRAPNGHVFFRAAAAIRRGQGGLLQVPCGPTSG